MHTRPGTAALIAAAITLAAPALAEQRCGWVENPTPANWWLRDRDGEWTISTMGGYQAPGSDEMPDMSKAGWVKTNGEHGYGCGCMVVEVDRASMRITRLISATPVRLARCRADHALPKP